MCVCGGGGGEEALKKKEKKKRVKRESVKQLNATSLNSISQRMSQQQLVRLTKQNSSREMYLPIRRHIILIVLN